jgi:hypothetical protein
MSDRVARWYIFKPKNPNLGKFRRSKKKVAEFYGQLVYYTAIWNSL